MPISSISDSFLLIYAQKLINNNQPVVIIIVDVTGVIRQNPEMRKTIVAFKQASPGKIFVHEGGAENDFFNQQDLMLISLDSWKKAIEEQVTWLKHIPSALLFKP